MDQTRVYISSRNRNLAKLAALNQPSLEEIAERPVPAHIPGQLSLDLWSASIREYRPNVPCPRGLDGEAVCCGNPQACAGPRRGRSFLDENCAAREPCPQK